MNPTPKIQSFPEWTKEDSDFGRYAPVHPTLKIGDVVTLKSDSTHQFTICDIYENNLIRIASVDSWGTILLQNVDIRVLQSVQSL